MLFGIITLIVEANNLEKSKVVQHFKSLEQPGVMIYILKQDGTHWQMDTHTNSI